MPDQNLQHPTFDLQFDCPDCGGVLLPVYEGGFLHFQCEVGHLYSPETLLNGQRERTEYAIWEAIRVATETARLLEKMAAQLDQEEQSQPKDDFQQQQQRIIAFLRQALSEFNKKAGTE
jgi:hypothetical protein